MHRVIVVLGALLASCSAALSSANIGTLPDLTGSQASGESGTSTASSASSVIPKAYANFEAWKADFVERAVAKGYDRDFVETEMKSVVLIPKVLASDNRQPEFSKPISSYITQAVTQARFSAARARLTANPNVMDIEAQYGVPASLLGGVWTMESDLGRIQGDMDVISALSSLAYEGRRRDWAETQILFTFTILKKGLTDRATLKGSWAGAMGQTQFLPENFLKLGVDGDHDGKVDIWHSDSDALASTANLLKFYGWKSGETWAVEVKLPAGFDYYLSETEKQPYSFWAAHNVVRADGLSFTAQEKLEPMVLILPSGSAGPAFLALPNHYVIRHYNNSTAYALSVGLIADGIDGHTLSTPWPVEPPMALHLRIKAQTVLKAQGFDPGALDGVIGQGTRLALKNWQRAHGRPADGYLSMALARELAGPEVSVSSSTSPSGTMKPIPDPL